MHANNIKQNGRIGHSLFDQNKLSSVLNFHLILPRAEPQKHTVSLFMCLLPAYCITHSKLSADTSNIGRDRYLLRTVLKLRSCDLLTLA